MNKLMKGLSMRRVKISRSCSEKDREFKRIWRRSL